MPQDLPLFKLGKKNKLSEFFSARFWDSQFFWLKREVLNEFPPKCFNTTEKHSLAVCDSIWGEKQFLLIFVPFYWFDQNNLFKQIQIFLRICIFLNMVRKKKSSEFYQYSFWEESVFWLKREVLCEFPPKILQNNRKA